MEMAEAGSRIPYKSAIVLMALALGAIVNHDVNKKGSFEASNTGIFLQDVGLYEQTLDVYFIALDTYDLGKAYTGYYVPLYYNRTRAAVGPAMDKAADQARWAYQETAKMGPIIVEKANEYIPGAKEKVTMFASEVSRVAVEAFEWTVV